MTNIHKRNKPLILIIWPQCRCDEFHHLPSSSENQLLGYFLPMDVKADSKETQLILYNITLFSFKIENDKSDKINFIVWWKTNIMTW